MSSIYSLISAGNIFERQMDTSANNLANANSTGYKEDQLAFREILSKAQKIVPQSGEELFLNHENLDQYVGMDKSAVMVDSVGNNFAQGPMKATNNALDLALENEGFFAISTPQGERFTRNGSFTLDAKNQIVNSEGNVLLGQTGKPIVANGTVINIDENGGVAVDGQVVDSLKLVRFRNPNGLQKLGQGFYAPVDSDNPPVVNKEIRVKQGTIEDSNVNTVKEMVRMIQANRSYESVMKSMSHIDQLNKKAISIVQA